MANDRVLVGGELSASAGLSGPLLTDHTGKCLLRAHDFQFSTGKGSQEEVTRRPETLTCAFVRIILFVFPSSYLLGLPSVLPLTHSFTHPGIQVSAHLFTRPPFHLTIYQVTLPPSQ